MESMSVMRFHDEVESRLEFENPLLSLLASKRNRPQVALAEVAVAQRLVPHHSVNAYVLDPGFLS